jgi:hypothetical protein
VHSRQHRFHVAGIETVVKVLKKFCVTGHHVLLPVLQGKDTSPMRL